MNKKLSKTSIYQAVLLTNGQFYFGQLSGLESQFPVLRDIYYFKISKQVQKEVKGTGDLPSTSGKVGSGTELNIIKFGTEIHKPIDELKINRDQIVLVETLQENSPVIQAIRKFKSIEELNPKL